MPREGKTGYLPSFDWEASVRETASGSQWKGRLVGPATVRLPETIQAVRSCAYRHLSEILARLSSEYGGRKKTAAMTRRVWCNTKLLRPVMAIHKHPFLDLVHEQTSNLYQRLPE